VARIISIARLWAPVGVGELFGLLIYGRLFRGHFPSAGFQMPGDLLCFWANGAVVAHPSALNGASVSGICAYMYPPPFLLVAAPLSWLTPFWCYMVWILVTNLGLAAAARAAGMGRAAIALGLALPPNLYCIAVGQNGALISALMLLGFGLAERNPLAAGLFAGCLVIKPQFAILLPVCFLASRNWRAMVAGAVTALAVCGLSLLVFGSSAWHAFFTSGTVAARAVLDEAWPKPFQGVMVSCFILLRSMGAGLKLAYTLQGFATVAAVVAAWRLWSRPEGPARLAVTLCLVVLATPYAYVYDLPALGMALAGYSAAMRWMSPLPLGVFTLFTSLYILLSMLGFAVGPLVLLLLMVMLWPMSVRRAHA